MTGDTAEFQCTDILHQLHPTHPEPPYPSLSATRHLWNMPRHARNTASVRGWRCAAAVEVEAVHSEGRSGDWVRTAAVTTHSRLTRLHLTHQVVSPTEVLGGES